MYRRNALSDLCESENVEKVCFYSHILAFTLIFNIFFIPISSCLSVYVI